MYSCSTLALFVCVGLVSSALAGQQAPTATSPAPAQAPEATATTPAAKDGDSKADTAPQANKTLHVVADTSGKKLVLKPTDPAAEMELKKLYAAGYKAEMRKGEIYFCREEQLVGSRFAKRVCLTAEDIERMAQTSKDEVEDLQRHQMNPSGR